MSMEVELERIPEINSNHIYQNRLLSGEKFRLLILYKGSGLEPIKCDLVESSVVHTLPSDEPSYEALSYAWGNQEKEENISLGGFQFQVTHNLYQALEHLRRPSNCRTLWIDAICINQCDNDEKNAQVKQMHLIYKRATKVIAWLGVADDDSKSAFGALEIIPELEFPPVATVAIIRLTRNGNSLNPARRLLSRPYWSRAWIVQEMHLASSLVIQCGYDVASYSALKKAIHPQRSVELKVTDENGFPQTDIAGGSGEKVLRLDPGTDITPHQFLDDLLDRQCSNRHDSIFAFYHILSSNVRGRLNVDYNIDCRTLFLQAARAIIEATQSLYIIIIKGRQRPTEGEDNWQRSMPSWCPYFATPYESPPLPLNNASAFFRREATVSFLGNDGLRVRGYMIGRIREMVHRRHCDRVGRCNWSSQETVNRELLYYRKSLILGLSYVPDDQHSARESIEATTRTLLGSLDKEDSTVEDLLDEVRKLRNGSQGNYTSDSPALLSLNRVWINTRFRSVALFAPGNASTRASIALVPHTARLDDAVCAVSGCPVVVVLRKFGKYYRVVGEAYTDTSYLDFFDVEGGLKDFVII